MLESKLVHLVDVREQKKKKRHDDIHENVEQKGSIEKHCSRFTSESRCVCARICVCVPAPHLAERCGRYGREEKEVWDQ